MSLTAALASATSGDVFVTGSERLARDLRIRHGILCAVKGAPVWKNDIHIHSFTVWVTNTWLSLWPETQLLHPVQELAVYKRRIDQDKEVAGNFLSTTGMARIAQKASALVDQYDITQSEAHYSLSAETLAFLNWRRGFDREIERHGWTTQSRLIEDLLAALERGDWCPGGRLIVAGIIDPTPQQRRFVAALRLAGHEVVEVEEHEPHATTTTYLRPADPNAELREAALWVRAQLETCLDSPNDVPRLAVIVPDVGAARALIDSTFREVVAPYLMLPGLPDWAKERALEEKRVPWGFSVGQALSEHELVATAMHVLQLRQGAVPFQIWSRLLKSRRIGGWGSEGLARARLEVQLRKEGGRKVSLDRVLAIADDKVASGFCARLVALKEVLNACLEKATPSTWADNFQARLTALGWPGDHPLHSDAYQELAAWDEALRVFRSMDGQLGEISEEQAYMWLREVVATRPFQPRSQFQPPVQILGLWDAIGLRFDKAFVLGLDASTLPAQEEPNPLVPRHLQRAANAPHCTPHRDLEAARKLVDALSRVAEDITFSCPMANGQGGVIAPSPLFPDWAQAEQVSRKAKTVIGEILSDGIKAVVAGSDEFPAVADGEKATLHGGTSILKHYAVSPFFAALRVRLGIEPLPSPTLGFDARWQGKVIHEVLNQFWGEVRTQGALKTMSDDDVSTKVASILGVVLGSGKLVPAGRYGKVLLQFESERLGRLIDRWLAYEKTRLLPFEVIGREVRCQSVIAGMPMEVVLDRVDKVLGPDGRAWNLIADYKAGSEVDPSQWNVDKLGEPQLPQYATRTELGALGITEADGIAFFHVHEFGCTSYTRNGFGGLLHEPTRRTNNAVETPEAWASEGVAWSKALEARMADFLAGNAGYDFAVARAHDFYRDLMPLVRYSDKVITRG